MVSSTVWFQNESLFFCFQFLLDMKWAESPAFLEEFKFCFSLFKKNLFAVADCVFSFSKCVLSFHLDSLYLSILIPLPPSLIHCFGWQTDEIAAWWPNWSNRFKLCRLNCFCSGLHSLQVRALEVKFSFSDFGLSCIECLCKWILIAFAVGCIWL